MQAGRSTRSENRAWSRYSASSNRFWDSHHLLGATDGSLGPRPEAELVHGAGERFGERIYVPKSV